MSQHPKMFKVNKIRSIDKLSISTVLYRDTDRNKNNIRVGRYEETFRSYRDGNVTKTDNETTERQEDREKIIM